MVTAEKTNLKEDSKIKHTWYYYIFYGGCFALVANHWFFITDWQWWIVIFGLNIINSLILMRIKNRARSEVYKLLEKYYDR